MQGVAIMLLSFFAVCWLIIAVYHVGFPQYQALGVLARALPMAYTGAALSIITAVMVFAAGGASHK